MVNTFKLKVIQRIVGIIAMAAIIGFTMASCGGSGKSSGTYVTEDGTSYTYSGDKVYFTASGNVMEFVYETKDGMVYSFYQSIDASSEDDRSIDIEGIVFTR